MADNYHTKLDPAAVIDTAAYNVLNKFRTYVEHEDLVSVGWIWVMDHPAKMDEFIAEESASLAAWKLDKAVWKVMERYARKERAHRIGYKPKDEAFYTAAGIESMLPRVLMGDPLPDRVERAEIRPTGDPAEGGDWLAGYIDVSRAWRHAKLTQQEKTILGMTYEEGFSQEVTGEALGLSQATVSRGHDRAIRKLQSYLGGPPVGDCPYSCECHEGKLRTRPGTKGNDAGRNQLMG